MTGVVRRQRGQRRVRAGLAEVVVHGLHDEAPVDGVIDTSQPPQALREELTVEVADVRIPQLVVHRIDLGHGRVEVFGIVAHRGDQRTPEPAADAPQQRAAVDAFDVLRAGESFVDRDRSPCHRPEEAEGHRSSIEHRELLDTRQQTQRDRSPGTRVAAVEAQPAVRELAPVDHHLIAEACCLLTQRQQGVLAVVEAPRWVGLFAHGQDDQLRADPDGSVLGGVDQRGARDVSVGVPALQEQQFGELDASGVVRAPGRRGHRPLEQMCGGGQVAARHRAVGRRAQCLRGSVAERLGPLVVDTELAPIAPRSFQMVPEDLHVVVTAVAARALEPLGIALVQVRPLFLRHGLVGRVADQQVPEPERVLARELRTVGPDQLLAREREQARSHLRAQPLGHERRHRAGVEHLALHRAAFHHRALLGIEAVQARGEQQLDGRRHREVGQILGRAPHLPVESQQAVVDQHADHLLDEQRVTVGRREDALASRRRQVVLAEQVVEQFDGGIAGQRLEQDRRRVHLAAAPLRAQLEQLGPRDHEQQHRGVAGPVGEVLHQVEQQGLGPVQVVDHQHERVRPRQVLEQPARGPRGVLRARRLGPAEHAADRSRDRGRLVGPVEHGVHAGPHGRRVGAVGQSSRLAHDLGERVVRDALAVGEAPPAQDAGAVSPPARNSRTSRDLPTPPGRAA